MGRREPLRFLELEVLPYEWTSPQGWGERAGKGQEASQEVAAEGGAGLV